MSRRTIMKTPVPPKLEELPSESQKNLLVGTIFCKDSPLQRKWLDLQLAFLKTTTQDFDHVAVLYGEYDSDYFSSRTEVIRINSPITDNIAHVTGLKFLAETFRSKRNMYRHFLFLDSDAFPIRTDWFDVLISKMRHHSIALPLRTENLETRIHASVLFSKNHVLDDLDFTVTQVGNDLLGGPESDVLVKKFQEERRREVFTMVRSNKLNIHPVMCGVYFDCFYHHCCGSGRAYNLRSKDYWDMICDKDINPNSYTEQLMKDPSDFIGKLAGWSPERYAKI
jgi:hypothetical protein